MKHKKLKKIIPFFFVVFLIAAAVFSGWPVIWKNPRIPPEIKKVNAAAKTFYFHSEVSALTGNWLLKEAAPELIVDDGTRNLTSATNDTSILYKPGVNNNSDTVIGHGTATAQGFGWWSDAVLDGTFDAGSWTFTIRNADNRDSITSHFDINVFKVPQNTSVSGATLLFQHIGTVDFWTNSIKTTTENTATVGPFTFTNEYLFIEIWDHNAANPSSGRVSRIYAEGSDLAAADRSRVTTPNFTLPAAMITAGSSNTQTANLNIPSTNNNVGGAFTFIHNGGSANVTQIIITEQGTVNANTNLSNVKLFYKTETTCSVAIPADATAFNSTGVGFNASEKAAVTGSMTVGTAQICLYIQLDVGSGAGSSQTLEIEISNPSTEVTVSSGTVNPSTALVISGTTTLVISGPSSSLSLKMADAAKNPTLFYLSGGALWMQEGVAAAVPLTSSEVTVTALLFTNVSYPNTPGTIRIQMTVASTNPENRQEYNFVKTLYTTANIRKK